MINVVEYEKSVSVVIPTCNGFGVIINAINSLVMSKYYIKEVFVVLSNSSPEYFKFLESVMHNYSHVLDVSILNAHKGNASAARNEGIKACESKYIALLDDDDIWMPNRLLEIFSNSNFKPDYVNFTVPLIMGHKDASLRIPEEKLFKTVADYLFIELGLIQTSDILLPSDIAKKHLFNEQLPRHQDYDFCLNLSLLGNQFNRLKINSTIWYQYPQTSIIKKGARTEFCFKWLTSKSEQLSLEEIEGYLKKEGWYIAYKDKRLFYFFYNVTINYGYRMSASLIKHMLMDKLHAKKNN